MGLMIWAAVIAAIIFFAFVATRMASQQDEDGLHDMGLALMEFGRAFPNEAVRNLHTTADGSTVFVRLHDNKAGFMRNMRGHYSCHLIEPGGVRVRPLPSARGLVIEFVETPVHSGQFEFASSKEAAEVSLWLLGNFVSAGDRAALAKPALR